MSDERHYILLSDRAQCNSIDRTRPTSADGSSAPLSQIFAATLPKCSSESLHFALAGAGGPSVLVPPVRRRTEDSLVIAADRRSLVRRPRTRAEPSSVHEEHRRPWQGPGRARSDAAVAAAAAADDCSVWFDTVSLSVGLFHQSSVSFFKSQGLTCGHSLFRPLPP